MRAAARFMAARNSGEIPSISGEEVTKRILSPIDLIIDSGKSKSKLPTTIVDCTSKTVNFLRIGGVSEEEVLEFLSK